MKTTNLFGAFAIPLGALPMFTGDGAAGARQIFDKQLSDVESEVMGVVETMQANRFDFVPTDGAFKTARTFGVQGRHIAFCLNEVAVALLGEPMLPHPDQEGPRNVTGKDDIVSIFARMPSATHTGPSAP
jgi:hypothetical protein